MSTYKHTANLKKQLSYIYVLGCYIANCLLGFIFYMKLRSYLSFKNVHETW